MNASSRQAGMALVESLVAITLLGVGLGGSAALLVQAIGNEREAALRATALRRVNSLADELRAALRDGSLPAVDTVAATQDVVRDCVAGSGACTLEQWIAWRIADWHSTALADLPDGAAARIEPLDDSGAAYRLVLTWPGRDPELPSRVELVVEP